MQSPFHSFKCYLNGWQLSCYMDYKVIKIIKLRSSKFSLSRFFSSSEYNNTPLSIPILFLHFHYHLSPSLHSHCLFLSGPLSPSLIPRPFLQHTHALSLPISLFLSLSLSLTQRTILYIPVCSLHDLGSRWSHIPLSSSASPSLPLLALLFNVSIWRKQTFNQTD